jgi:hypothetical protein
MNHPSNGKGDGKPAVDSSRDNAKNEDAGKAEGESSQPAKRSVRFDPSTSNAPPSTAADAIPPKKRPPRMHPDAIPKHLSPTKVGKANPVRDLSLFLGFIVFVMYVTYDFGNPEPAKSSLIETMEMAAENVNQMSEALTRMAERQFEKTQASRPNVPCALFASPSAIPGAGLGLFAGRDYAMGEIIPVFPEGLQAAAGAAGLLPIPVNDGGFGSDGSFLWAPAHALLLKHHPLLANVNGTLFVPHDQGRRPTTDKAAFEMTATQPIKAGTELFATLEAHPHGHLLHANRNGQFAGWRHPNDASSSSSSSSRPFSRIPTPGDYELADQIWDDADLAVRRMRTVHRLAQVHCGTWFGTLKGVVSTIHPNVGSLLPATQPPHERGNHTAALASLKNQTVLQLRVKGSCVVDDVVYPAPSSTSDASPRAVAGRHIKKGALLTRIPLYAVPAGSDPSRSCSPTDHDAEQGGERECSFEDDPFRHPLGISAGSSSVVLYPLAHAGLLLTSKGRDGDDSVEKPDGGPRSIGGGNLDIQWADVAWSLHPSLMWNVVATADIRQGDEVRRNARICQCSSLRFDLFCFCAGLIVPCTSALFFWPPARTWKIRLGVPVS